MNSFQMVLAEVQGLRSMQRMDANETVFFARQLEAIKAQTFDIKYPTLKARDFVPVSGDVGPGATSVTYRQFDKVGRAKIIGPNAKDVPRVDVSGLEFNRPVRPWGDSYGWTIFELQSAAMAGVSLNSMRASAARRAIEEGLDQTAATGAPDYGIPTGFLNDAAVPAGSVPNGVSTNPEWSTKTADEILLDVSAADQRIVTASNGVEKADTILVPDAQHALISTLPRSSVSDTTVLEFIMRAYPNITAIEPWYRLAGAGSGASDRMVMYSRSAEKVSQDITQEYTELPIQEQGFELIVNAFAKTAGVQIPYPLSIDYSDDI